ncbi:MAG: class I SAM-dependent methyltransferase [Candidatus Acidiferrales bacterium]
MSVDAERAQSRERQLDKPAPLVRRFAAKIAEASGGLPILDVACGSGRNAIPLLKLGCTVICIDQDLSRLPTRPQPIPDNLSGPATPELIFRQMDLLKDSWPFGESSIGGIINIHFFSPSLVPAFERSLAPGGYLLLETVPGCGGNYLELPKAGAVRNAFGTGHEFEFYNEHRVGPNGFDAVTVRMLARRRS